MTEIFDRQDLRNHSQVFKDRLDAGRVLGEMLHPGYAGRKDVFLLGIPMGGVPVAVTIAGMLGCPMDLIVVRKIQVPGNTEAGFGAMTTDGDVFYNEPLMARLALTEEQIRRQSEKVRCELADRDQRLRAGRPLPDLEGKTAILVDDGLASGFTMKASIFLADKRRAAKTVVAVPTAPLRSIHFLEGAVQEIYCANVRGGMSFAVADAYEIWHDLSESEVLGLLSGGGGASR
jgi:putative phosphoribosyl transferase